MIEKLRSLLGADAVLAPRASGEPPRVAPAAADAAALFFHAAMSEGWRVRVEGAASWIPADAPADVVLTTRRLDRVTRLDPQDLVATVEAGVPLDALLRRLAEHGMWLPLDPPGAPGRTLGSVIATATAGPLRTGFGPVRDHLLGVTVVTGDGRLIESGGRVMKNVAGYDLTRLQAGAFGAFGVVTAAHVRLRAVPRADRTFVRTGARDALLDAAADLVGSRLEAAALEVVSPAAVGASEWVLAVRLAGSPAQVDAAESDLRHAGGFRVLDPADAPLLWRTLADGPRARAVVLRAGALPESLPAVLDRLTHDLREDWIAAAPATGAVRWAGDAPPERLRALRHALAVSEVPVTLERAPWAVRRAVGHFGAYREGVGGLVDGLRATFDPGGRIVTPLGAAA